MLRSSGEVCRVRLGLYMSAELGKRIFLAASRRHKSTTYLTPPDLFPPLSTSQICSQRYGIQMSQFQFVAINGTVDEGSRGGRRIVRSHVMRRYHHERKVRGAMEVHRYLHQKASGIQINQQGDQHGDKLAPEPRIGYQIVPSHPYIHSCIIQRSYSTYPSLTCTTLSNVSLSL